MHMNLSQEQLVHELFVGAFELPSGDQEAFVMEQSKGDDAVAARVMELLRTPAAGNSILAKAQAAVASALSDLAREAHPEHIGPFRIIKVLGSGGMGTVYQAEQERPVRRSVALKLIKLGMDSEAILARFAHEQQALASMDHDGIAKVYDCGISERGQPYFAMEYVDGAPLNIYCDTHKLSIAGRLELMRQVCAAVMHAHQKGIVHRDLKPGNVLVTGRDGEPKVKVIDFGLAKAMQDTEGAAALTAADMVMGTPGYMAPEQAGRKSGGVDTRVDIYSLGVMLYEQLTGCFPFSWDELSTSNMKARLETLNEAEEPPRPSSRLLPTTEAVKQVAADRQATVPHLAKLLRNDLDWVVLKALRRNPADRYESASALGADLQRFLRHEPLQAGPPSTWYRTKKLVRRNRGKVLAALSLLMVTTAGYFGYAFSVNALAAKERDFDTAAASVLYKQLLRQEEQLYPALPDKLGALREWLTIADSLLGKANDVASELESLRSRMLPVASSHGVVEVGQRELLERRSLLAKHVKALQYANDIRVGRSRLIVPSLSPQLTDWNQMSIDAFARTAMETRQRLIYGLEAEGLALARAAALMPDGQFKPQVFDKLAWAALANGQDEEARSSMRKAIDLCKPPDTDVYVGHLATLEKKIEKAESELREREVELSCMETALKRPRGWSFADYKDEFLYNTLDEISVGLGEFSIGKRQNVARRLRWAERVADASLSNPKVRHSWDHVRAAIRAADGVHASELYRNQRIELADSDVIGLVPIGMNPATKLWEFYDLRSAWDGEVDPMDIPIPDHAGPSGSIPMTGQTGIVFVLVPGGTFWMGSQNTDPNAVNYDAAHRSDEALHQVALSPFFLARHETTQGQWDRLWSWDDTNKDPSNYSWTWHTTQVSKSNPVEQIDWDSCRILLSRYGLALPTEAQWEYACRAGTDSAWWTGKDSKTLFGRAWVPKGVGRGEQSAFNIHAGVGRLEPNAFGFHDMHANVAEWCEDVYTVYGNERPGDGLRPSNADKVYRCVRGGSFGCSPIEMRSAHRGKQNQTAGTLHIGVRVARPLTHMILR